MNIKNHKRKGEKMTREELFKDIIKVEKGEHWCLICDAEADFVITNRGSEVSLQELPLCKECAKLLKGKIDVGLSME